MSMPSSDTLMVADNCHQSDITEQPATDENKDHCSSGRASSSTNEQTPAAKVDAAAPTSYRKRSRIDIDSDDIIGGTLSASQLMHVRTVSATLRQLIVFAMSTAVENGVQFGEEKVSETIADDCALDLHSNQGCVVDDNTEVVGMSQSQAVPIMGKYRTKNERYAADLAHKKAGDVVRLERELRESNHSNSHLTTTISSLRLTVTQTQQRLTNTNEALRIAANNAASARCDADKAQEKLASLTARMALLQRTVEETRSACSTVRKEHEEISASSREINAQLMQCEAELHQNKATVAKLKDDNSQQSQEVKQLKADRDRLQDKVDTLNSELDRSHDRERQQSKMEGSRSERMHRLESELRHHKALLIQATHSSAEQEATAATLNDTIVQLKAENVRLHASIQQARTDARKERANLSEKIHSIELERQELKLKCEEITEQIQAKNLKEEQTKQQLQQLRQRISSLEQQRERSVTVDRNKNNNKDWDSNNSPHSRTHASATKNPVPPLIKTPSISRGRSHSSALKDVTNKTRTVSIHPLNCSICDESPFGLMKSCQCGKHDCKLRAHASCATNKMKKSIENGESSIRKLVLCSNDH